jgi:hypothetical protein
VHDRDEEVLGVILLNHGEPEFASLQRYTLVVALRAVQHVLHPQRGTGLAPDRKEKGTGAGIPYLNDDLNLRQDLGHDNFQLCFD